MKKFTTKSMFLIAALLVTGMCGCSYTHSNTVDTSKTSVSPSDAITKTHNIMVYGDSNSYGWVPVENPPTTRYARDVRWTGALQNVLGNNYNVISEALSGRTTDIDDAHVLPASGANGVAYLPTALSSQLPLDMVIIMLGTNDLKIYLDRSVEDIVEGNKHLIESVRNTTGGVGTIYGDPKILVLGAVPLGDIEDNKVMDSLFGEEGKQKSKELGKALAVMAKAEGVYYLDLAKFVPHADGIDGVHLSKKSHAIIAQAVHNKIMEIEK